MSRQGPHGWGQLDASGGAATSAATASPRCRRLCCLPSPLPPRPLPHRLKIQYNTFTGRGADAFFAFAKANIKAGLPIVGVVFLKMSEGGRPMAGGRRCWLCGRGTRLMLSPLCATPNNPLHCVPPVVHGLRDNDYDHEESLMRTFTGSCRECRGRLCAVCCAAAASARLGPAPLRAADGRRRACAPPPPAPADAHDCDLHPQPRRGLRPVRRHHCVDGRQPARGAARGGQLLVRRQQQDLRRPAGRLRAHCEPRLPPAVFCCRCCRCRCRCCCCCRCCRCRCCH